MIESKLTKLIRALNPNLIPANIQAKRTTLFDITREKFLVFDPLIARIFVFIYYSLKSLMTTIFKIKTDAAPLSTFP